MTDAPYIRTSLRPGDLGRLIQLHCEAYEGEANHFGLTFEAHVDRTAIQLRPERL